MSFIILCDIKTKITATGRLILDLPGFHLTSIVFALSKLHDLKMLSGAVCLKNKKKNSSLRVKIQVIKFECPQDFVLFVHVLEVCLHKFASK